MRSNLVDIEVVHQHSTEKAVCVRGAVHNRDVWVPRSMVEIEGEEFPGKRLTLTGPQSFFEEKELV